MREAIKTQSWCDSPYYVRELTDLYIVGSRVDVWRNFLLSDKIDVLRELEMSVCSFNRYSMFDRLIIMLNCSEDEAVKGIRSIMLDGDDTPIEFRRNSIHDDRAWAWLPLSCFTDAQGFNDWDRDKELWQDDILKFNPMPQFQIGIKKQWVVSPDCLVFSHKLKVDKKSWPHEKKRFAQVSFNHPDLDRRFKGNQHVVDGFFHSDKAIPEVREELTAKAMIVCAKHGVKVLGTGG